MEDFGKEITDPNFVLGSCKDCEKQLLNKDDWYVSYSEEGTFLLCSACFHEFDEKWKIK